MLLLLQEITVKVIYDIIRPDGSKINLRDLDDFGCGTLWMHFGCSDGGDGYIELDDEVLRALSGPTWVDGTTIKDSHGITALFSSSHATPTHHRAYDDHHTNKHRSNDE